MQGEAVKAKQQQVNDKHKQLQNVKGHKNTLLYKGKQEKTSCIHTPIHNVWRGTGGTETSKYPEEKKENSIS